MNSITDAQEYFDQTFNKVHLGPDEIISGKFTDCVFFQCIFESAILNNCRFSNCLFQECNLNLVKLPGSSFPATRFEKSKLMGVDWTQATWSTSGFYSIVHFLECVISHSTFIGLELKRIQITNCIANEVDFRDADLSNADFKGTDLARSFFGNTNLSEADLSQARNYMIDPSNNILKQAKFSMPEAMALLYSMDIVLKDQNDPTW
jgi:fluoroquinolone resistance protein